MVRLPCSQTVCALIALGVLLVLYLMVPTTTGKARATANADGGGSSEGWRNAAALEHHKLRIRTSTQPVPTYDAPAAKAEIPSHAAVSMAERYERIKQQRLQQQQQQQPSRAASMALVPGAAGGGAARGADAIPPPPVASAAHIAAARATLLAARAAAAAPVAVAPIRLLSLAAPVRASTKGNLGGPEQVVNDLESDWLAHRWQIAKDMTGSPLPLPQYIDLQLSADANSPLRMINRVRLDWESAFARVYRIQVAASLRDRFVPGVVSGLGQSDAAEWTTIFDESNGSAASTRHQHIVHDIDLLKSDAARAVAQRLTAKHSASELPALPPAADGSGAGFPARYVRLWIVENGAPWGASLWRFEVYGR